MRCVHTHTHTQFITFSHAPPPHNMSSTLARTRTHTLSHTHTIFPFLCLSNPKGKHKYSRHTNNQRTVFLSRSPSLSRVRALSLSLFHSFFTCSLALTISPHTLFFSSRADAHTHTLYSVFHDLVPSLTAGNSGRAVVLSSCRHRL